MRTLVVGASGHYGRIICRKLKEIPGVTVIGAGRNAMEQDPLGKFAAELGIKAITMDLRDPGLDLILMDNRIDLVVNVAGVFREQDYALASACIRSRCYYIDMADDRVFVQGIKRLHHQARSANVFIGSGFGMTAVNMAILNYMAVALTHFDHIFMGYSGAGTIPGPSSIRSSLLSCGKAITQVEARRDKHYNGLMGRHMKRFADGFMDRDLLNLDAPELDLVRAKFDPLTLRYQGGFGARGQRSMEFLAKVANANWITRPEMFVKPLSFLGKLMTPMSAGKGGLYVHVEGRSGRSECAFAVEIHASNAKFDQVKCSPIVAFVQRLMNDYVPEPGAYPANDMVSLSDLKEVLSDKDFEFKEAFVETPPMRALSMRSDDIELVSAARIRMSEAA